MKVKELIKLLSNVNPNALVIVDEDWCIRSMAKNIDCSGCKYAQEALFRSQISEVEESADKTYIRLW